jgi:PPIC-type PPIASE domain
MSKKPARVCGLALLILVFTHPLKVFGQIIPATPVISENNEVALQVMVVRTPEEAQELLRLLKKGENFPQVAREKSIDPTSDAGGYMGEFALSALRAELREALKSVGPGQITPVVHIPSGYAILKIINDSSESSKTVDPARSFVLASTRGVKYGLDVDGLVEAETALLRFPKESRWNAASHRVCELRKQPLTDTVNRMKEALEPDAGPAAQQVGGLSSIQADYNNDGCTDILVLRGGWEFAQRKSLLRNNCDDIHRRNHSQRPRETDRHAGSSLGRHQQ